MHIYSYMEDKHSIFVLEGDRFMHRKMTEQEIISSFDQALKEGQIYLVYQPKYNHSTGRLIGAEALMRWQHPEFGEQLPDDFIPVMEDYGLIHRADLFAFEEICRFHNSCPNYMLPISFNISRHDLFGHDYVSEIEAIRRKYDVPVQYFRAEITESSAIGGFDLVSNAVKQFHEKGYLVEMDDFGSGYSSLSILKNLPVDFLKLDLRFLAGEGLGGRGGVIVNAVVQMAKWLNTPTLAEGVETIEQADFLKSIGCNYVQGYLYSKPMSKEDFMMMLLAHDIEPTKPSLLLIKAMEAERFWDPDSLETLIFNNYVGAAAIFSYERGDVDMLRINSKYVKESGMNLTEQDILSADFWESFSPENREIYEKTIRKAIQTGMEETCETWRTYRSKCCGVERVCLRSGLRVIGRGGDQAIIYAIVQNITEEKRSYQELAENEKRFQAAFEQANMYAWEYNIDTHEMRPCFRCMRDLGLPPVVKNYPEPVIESGLFPPDYADMYREWHRKLEDGVGELEAIIPLTVGRIPFHVRYTTEFDETGHPLKAYGSATLVVDSDKQDQSGKTGR